MKIYDADQVTFALGPILAQGLVDGEFITITDVADERFKLVMSIDGEGTRSKDKNEAAIVELKLVQSSSANDKLSALHEADKAAPNGAGVVPLFIRDRSGRALYSAPEAYISKAPAVSFDKTAKERVWTITCPKLIRFDGGN